MTVEETIERAIDKLEAAKEEIRSQGPWWVQKKSEALGGYWIRGLGDEVVGEMYWKSDAHLIVTLHRTIDAQLAILNTVHTARRVEQKWDTLVYTEDALRLAIAILGED